MPEVSPSNAVPPPPAPSHKRTTWKFNLIVVLISILAPIAILVALILAPIWDGPPVDDADMFTERALVPEEENGFDLLMEAFEMLDMQSATQSDFREWLAAPEDHLREIKETLAANQPFFPALEKALSKGRLQSPPVDFSGDSISYGVSESMTAASLLSMAVREAEDPMEALKFVRLGLYLGNQILGDTDTLIKTLVGVACRSNANESVMHLARNPEIPTDALWQTLTLLKTDSPPWEPWKNAIRTEYQFLIHALTHIDQNQKYGFFEEHESSYATFSFAFQPNNTRRIALPIYRNAIRSLETGDLETLIHTERFITDLMKETNRRAPWDPRRHHNRTGNVMVLYMLPTLDTFVHQAYRLQAENQAAILVTALQLHLREQGELPHTLRELVPDYLAEIPADPFDGQPFRYDRSASVVYAIGQNLVDNGGSTKMRRKTRSPTRNSAEDSVFGILAPIGFTSGD